MYYASVNQKIKTVCIEDKKCFNIEVAKTPTEMILGLSNRSSLNSDGGMLFVFDAENIPYFWMKDMQFPLDIIWINQKMKIVGIEKNLQPCNPSYCSLFKPDEKIKYVMEINGNQSEKYNFKAGDFVNFGKA
jgi:hypothetical protein